MNTKILLCYATEMGSTAKMADSAAEGVRSIPDVDLKIAEIVTGDEVTQDDFLEAHGIILGTPVRHRNMHHRMKVMIEKHIETLWLTDSMVGKVGGVFTAGGGHGNVGAGAEMCQLGMLAALAANGLLIVPFPKCTPGADEACSHWGPSGRTGGAKMMPQDLTEGMLTAVRHHAANITRVATVIKDHPDIFARGNVSPTPEVLAMFQGGE